MLGMPCRRVDRLLQILVGIGERSDAVLWTAMDVAQKELRDPLVLLVAARRAEAEIGFAVAQCQRRRQRGARAFAGCKPRRMLLVEPEHLRARAETKAELGYHRRR